MKKLFFLLISTVMCLSSCTTVYKSANVAKSVNGNAVINPIVANLDMANFKELKGSSKSTYLLFFRISGDKKFVESSNISFLPSRTGTVQNAALYNALKGSDCDVVISPLFETVIQTKLLGLIKTYSVTVRGYGAKVSSFDQIKPGDPDFDVLATGKPAERVEVNKK